MKLCVIYNSAPHYRKGIFKLMEEEYDIDWYFDKALGDIKSLPPSFFKHPNYIENRRIIGPLYWQKGIQKLISDSKYNHFLILGELYSLSTWIILIKKKIFYPKKRIYLWSHGWYGKESLSKRIFKKIFFNMSDGIFLYGNRARDLMIQNGFNPKNLHVIHNSLDYDQQLLIRNSLKSSNIYQNHFGNTNPVLLFIGRLTKVKKLNQLIDAVELLKQEKFFLNIVFVGEGEMKNALQHQVENLELSNQVWFYGKCYEEEKNGNLIYNADLCISPGNVGLTAMHSLVYGTPVITHNDLSFQMPEFEAVKEGETGSFFSRDSIFSLAKTIKNWIITHPNREEVRTACFNEIDQSWTPKYQINVLKANIK